MAPLTGTPGLQGTGGVIPLPRAAPSLGGGVARRCTGGQWES